jgi:hypothetical protein
MIETGTRKQFKDCVLDQLWVWELKCGHKLIAQANFREEFSQLDRRQIKCPVCERMHDEHLQTPENMNIFAAIVINDFRNAGRLR